MFMVSENFVSKLTNLKYNILNQLAIIQSQHKYSISDYKKLPEEEQEKIKKICDAIEGYNSQFARSSNETYINRSN